MTSKTFYVIAFLLCATLMGRAQQVTVNDERFVPAGTILGCTIDEPNFSSQTARQGDPLLCKTNSAVAMFGRQLIPRGASLSGRLRNYRDPGHFVGKGWILLEFTSVTLPGGTIPLDARVISAGPYRVDRDGKIQGRGHAKRDAVEWAFSDSMAGKGTHAARVGSTAGSQSRDTRRIAAHGGPDDSGIGVPEFQPVDDEILGFRAMTEVPDPQFMRLCRQPQMRADEGSRGQSASGRSR